MGSPVTEKGRDKSENQVKVTLSKGFWMSETEVTQGTWTTATESFAADDNSAGRVTVRVLPRTAFDLAVAPDGKHWITATNKSIICWRLGWKEPIWERSYPRARHWQRSIKISDQQVLVYEWDGPAFVWDLKTGAELWRKDADVAFATLKHPYVMISHRDRGVEVWRAERLDKYFGDGKQAGEAREFGMKPRLKFRWCMSKAQNA